MPMQGQICKCGVRRKGRRLKSHPARLESQRSRTRSRLSRVLYIHVGPPKTGTTAVQDVLRVHDNTVVIYPQAGRWADGSHHNLVFNFFRDYARAATVQEEIDTLFGRIATEAERSDSNVLISSEVLFGRKRAPDFVRELLARLGPDFRAEILFVVRNHFERAASVYNQRVKDAVFCERREPDEFLVQHASALCYEQTLRRFRKTQLDLSVLNYHPAHDFVARFLTHVGFAEEQIPPPVMRNVSLSTKSLVATLAANRIAASAEARDRIVGALRTMPGSYAPSQFIFGADAVSLAEMEFAPDRAFLRQEFGIEFPADNAAHRTGAFRIGEEEFANIAEALSGLGTEGAEALQAIRAYQRPAGIRAKG
jgi:hypothetical protein